MPIFIGISTLNVLILIILYRIMSKNVEFVVTANTIVAVHPVVTIRIFAGVKQ
jgi:hypothetical protein